MERYQKHFAPQQMLLARANGETVSRKDMFPQHFSFAGTLMLLLTSL